ncbi:MAG TPA: dihydrodipicolinate reductase C-terminal domain-containing protein [Terriglobia bacterium]|nr:dihydrodipicolinate reductase C-terminal domain-containing protein [Terriglobia bacterium]
MSTQSSERAQPPRNLNLALLGHGKMGGAVARIAPERGYNLRLILTIESNPDGMAITEENFRGIDVAIDFTQPDVVVENIRRVARLGVNLVVGTTGWDDRLAEVEKIVAESGIGLVHAANFSIGVQLFYRLAREAARIFAPYSMYEPYIVEAHHKFKKDAPSGTAIELKRRIEPNLPSREIPTSSVRGGYIPGMHELGFDSETDAVIVRHNARSRQGFAEGALYAARWVAGKKGMFGFDKVLE